MKEFVFLYPIPEYIDFGIKNYEYSEQEESVSFRDTYKSTFNQVIDTRYRQKRFNINYVLFNEHEISDVVELQATDNLISAGIDFKTHTTKQPNGEYLYADPNIVLDQLPNIQTIRITGFHLWDCVEKMAKNAYERKLDVLVDEDLTEIFSMQLKDPNFKVNLYPSVNPRNFGESIFQLFMEARKTRPWLWQDY